MKELGDARLSSEYVSESSGYDNVIVSPSDIKLYEEGGVLHVIDEFWDKGQRICIVNGVEVKIMIVLAGSEGSIFFGNEEWCCLREFLWPVFRCSSMNIRQVSFSLGFRG